MMRVALFLITNLAVMFVFGIILSLTGIQEQSILGLIIMAGLFGFGGSFISLLISKWMALRSVGGRIIKNPITETEHWLLNVIKHQSEQVGISMPDVAIYNAPNINAFATGACRKSSLVAVSSGLLENMNRDEVEAVIAHEITHIANGDMVTMTLLQGVLNTFVIFISRIIAQIVSGVLLSNSDDENNHNSNSIIYCIVSMALEVTFGLLANIIIMWFSRYREFLADAGSARLVGKEKMIAALQRLKVSYDLQQEASNIITLYIHDNSSKSFGELFLSHPKLDKRIKALRIGTYSNLLNN